MKRPFKSSICCFLLLAFLQRQEAYAQSDQHYTMFMYNKLLYNPGYAGSRDVMSANAVYRDQWTGINGAPKTMNISLDGPLGNYMQSFRKVAIGVSINNEKLGVENNTSLKAYYAYRIKLSSSVVSFGLEAGADMYSANYSQTNPFQQNDPNLTNDVKNVMLPNFGAGVYWSGDNFYAGLSVPNFLQNYYDKKEVDSNTIKARQIRTYYICGGYVFPLNETFKLEPQVLVRYAGNATYKLPVSSDFNLSLIAYDRLMLGFTYRTDKSMEVIVHVQATKKVNIGYSYDYLMSALNGYSKGTHEIVLGYDFIKENSKYTTPRFIRAF
ncbi:MAG: type IX secretion system membrane protein PorP/SprF [Chitinophagales bacterium]